MEKKIKFSVILPIYIKIDYIIFRKSFESILNQTLKPNEIIIIFDGPVKKNIQEYVNKKKKKIKIY